MSSHWLDQLLLVPILLPLLSAAVLVFINQRRHQLKFAINLFSCLALLGNAVALVYLTDAGFWERDIAVYLAANWAPPFGIALMADRLAAMMLLLTAVIALASLFYAYARWSRTGVHFHSLFQFLLMGINGAFLTGDLFNLFVFFEIMLAASYGLVLHGFNAARVRAGMQYIVINLVSSLFFLIGVALIYAAAGTLNMADLATRLTGLTPTDRLLLETGAAILAVAFLTKSAVWPLGFWLPTTYSAASPPVAAMLVLMTKVGVYVLLRLWLLVFADHAGVASALGANALLAIGVVTIAFGSIGLLASQELGRMAGYSAIISSGTLLAAIGHGQPNVISAALFYLISSTLAVAALVMLIELIDRIRKPSAAMLALTMEAFAIEDTAAEEESAGVPIPAAMAFLGLAFFASALIIAGLPPLSGFIAKFSLFHAMLNPHGLSALTADTGNLAAWLLMALIIVSGLAAIISLMRYGVRTFWATESTPPRLQLSEAGAVAGLLLLCIIATAQAGPLRSYLDRVSIGLHHPDDYTQRVLTAPTVPGVILLEGSE